MLRIRQRGQRTDRPRRKLLKFSKPSIKCTKVIDDLVKAMKPLTYCKETTKPYWFFGKHVTERLNCMREEDADSAGKAIMELLDNFQTVYKDENLT
jgi:hypothetical protein